MSVCLSVCLSLSLSLSLYIYIYIGCSKNLSHSLNSHICDANKFRQYLIIHSLVAPIPSTMTNEDRKLGKWSRELHIDCILVFFSDTLSYNPILDRGVHSTFVGGTLFKTGETVFCNAEPLVLISWYIGMMLFWKENQYCHGLKILSWIVLFWCKSKWILHIQTRIKVLRVQIRRQLHAMNGLIHWSHIYLTIYDMVSSTPSTMTNEERIFIYSASNIRYIGQ